MNCVGVNLHLNETLIIKEGGRQRVCVTISDPLLMRERDIHVSYLILPQTNTGGKCIYYYNYVGL